jgi:hypothetical protein
MVVGPQGQADISACLHQIIHGRLPIWLGQAWIRPAPEAAANHEVSTVWCDRLPILSDAARLLHPD